MTTYIDKVREALNDLFAGYRYTTELEQETRSALQAHEAEVKELVEALEGLLKEAELIYEKRYYATPDRHKYNIHFNAARAILAKVKP